MNPNPCGCLKEKLQQNRNSVLLALFCMLTGGIILMICSMCSPLYPFNQHWDVNCFITVARGVQRGMIPYRDLMDHKGPLLYYLHALALSIFPGRFFGIFVWEWISMTFSLYFMYRIAKLYLPKVNAGWLAVLIAVVCASHMFVTGDMNEEMCLPFMLCSLYAGLKSLRGENSLRLKDYVLHGFLAGCVMCIKLNLLGMHFAFMAVLALDALIREKNFFRVLKMCACFLLGMLLAALPWIVWLGIHGALDELWDTYIIANCFGYGQRKYSIPVRVVQGFLRNMRQNPVFSVLMMVGMASMLVYPLKRMKWMEKLLWTGAFLAMMLFIYMGGVANRYYILAFAPFVVLALLPLALLEKISPPRTASVIAMFCLLAAGTLYAYEFSENAPYIGSHFEDTPQGKVAAYIDQSEERTLLNYCALDNGFYYAADIMPVNRYFCGLNINKKEIKAEHDAIVRDGTVKFVITSNATLEEMTESHEKYKLVMQIEPDGKSRFEKHYYLYERTY